jgi:hypothetical protein
MPTSCQGAILEGSPAAWRDAVAYHNELCEGEYGYVAERKKPFGIVLLACGPANIYREWAFNLVVGIRRAEQNFGAMTRIPITLLVDEENRTNGLWDMHFEYITDVVVMKDCHLRRARTGKREWHKGKAHAWRYSPYELTWQIDVDSVWIDRHQDPWAIYHKEKEHDWLLYTYHVKSMADPDEDFGWWMRSKDYQALYGIPVTHRVTCCNSSWMHYRLTDKVRAVLETAEAAFESMAETGWELVDAGNTPRDKHPGPMLDIWRDGIPDEAPLTIASTIHDLVPGLPDFRPAFWGWRDGEEFLEGCVFKTGGRIVTMPGFSIKAELLGFMNHITARQNCEIGNQHWRKFYSKGEVATTGIKEAWRN